MSGAPRNFPAPPEQQVKLSLPSAFATRNLPDALQHGVTPHPFCFDQFRLGDSPPKVRAPPRNHQVATPPGYRRNLTSPLRTKLHPSRVFVNQKTQNIGIDTVFNHNRLCLSHFRNPGRSCKSSNLKENQLTAKQRLQAIVLNEVFRSRSVFFEPCGEATHPAQNTTHGSTVGSAVRRESQGPKRRTNRRSGVL